MPTSMLMISIIMVPIDWSICDYVCMLVEGRELGWGFQGLPRR